MGATIRREGDRVRLEGVQGWFCGEKESSVHAAQEAAMRAVGEDVSYEYLVGVSGLAFRMQVHEGFCPSSPHSFCGYRCVKRSVEALPWSVQAYEVHKIKPDETAKIAEVRRAVVESIDRGVPVQYGSEEDGVVVGYGKGGAEWLCLNPYHEGGKTVFVEEKLPWGVLVFTRRKAEMPSRRDLAAGALRQAVEMSAMERTPPGEGAVYFLGFAAWDVYMRKLVELDAVTDPTALKGFQHGNAWIYECLAQYRDAGSTYLRMVAGEFDAGTAEHIRKAAGLYDRMANEVLRDKEHCVITVAPYPWMKEGAVWTAEMRREQVRRLKEALLLERQAVAELTAALALIEKGPRPQ